MTSYEQRVSLLEFLHQKPGVTLPDVPEAPEPLEGLIRNVFDELHRSKDRLRQQVTVLEAQNKDLKEYPHVVAHDLQDSLTVLILVADLVGGRPDLEREELEDYLLQIKSTAYEMKEIIENLLLFAEVSKVEAPLEAVQMDRVVARVKDRLSYAIKEHQAQIILPEAWPQAIGYGPWIEEVWANYVSNAIKYGGQPPRVELGASSWSDGMLRFWTRDNGPGIPPVAHQRLFTPFDQINRLSGPRHGLGLWIVHNIVEKLGGQVGVESEVGQGSLFFFTLPGESSSSAQNLL